MDLIERAMAKAPAQRKAEQHEVVAPLDQDREQLDSATRPAPPKTDDIHALVGRRITCDSETLRQRRIVAELPNDPVANMFGVLRTRVLHKLRKHNSRTLAILGPTAGVGKSTVAANLAVAMALDSEQTVLLVDLDLRRPMLAGCFGFDLEYGVSDYLLGNTSLEAILVDPGIERLVLVPERPQQGKAFQELSSSRISEFVYELRELSDSSVLLFDLPPLLGLADTLSFLPSFDAGLLVLEEGQSSSQDIQDSAQLLGETPLVGTVVNKARETQSPYQNYYYYSAQERGAKR